MEPTWAGAGVVAPLCVCWGLRDQGLGMASSGPRPACGPPWGRSLSIAQDPGQGTADRQAWAQRHMQ